MGVTFSILRFCNSAEFCALLITDNNIYQQAEEQILLIKKMVHGTLTKK